jgi:hypothetical protein
MSSESRYSSRPPIKPATNSGIQFVESTETNIRANMEKHNKNLALLGLPQESYLPVANSFNGSRSSATAAPYVPGGSGAKTNLKRTPDHHVHAGHRYVVYTGPRGGRYIKRGDAWVRLSRKL